MAVSPRRPHARAFIRAVAVVLLVLTVPFAAGAHIPTPPRVTLPQVIPLIGASSAGEADPAGQFSIVVRDFIGNLIPNASVEIDLMACSDLRIAAQQPFAGLHTECASHVVWAKTDGAGTARFSIVGDASNSGAAEGSGFLAGRVYVDGTFVGTRTVCAYDQDGLNGVAANDVSRWLADYSAGRAVGRSDYDGSAELGANDLSLWLAVYFAAGSRASAGSLPGGLCP